MNSFLAVIAIFACVAAVTGQMTCTQQAFFQSNMDGTPTSVTCSNGGSLGPRCPGCCQSWAMSRGGSAMSAAGFINQNQNACVCCMQGGSAAAPAFAANGGCQGGNCFRKGDERPVGRSG